MNGRGDVGERDRERRPFLKSIDLRREREN